MKNKHNNEHNAKTTNNETAIANKIKNEKQRMQHKTASTHKSNMK